MTQSTTASEAQLRLVIEAAPDGIVVSRNGIILFVNPAAVSMLGYESASELVGTPMSGFLDASEIAVMRERVMMTMREGRVLGPHEYAARRRDGASVVAEITSLPIDWDGSPAVIALARNVTDRAHMQAQVARADRMTALGTLAAGIGHEVNNPLAYMALAVDKLEAILADVGAEQRAAALAAIGEIRDGAARVAAIVGELRAFSLDDRSQQDSDASCDVRDLVAAVERLVAHDVRHRAALRTEVGALPRVLGSMHRLQQVLMNLVLNAAQALDGHRPDPQIVVRATAGAEGTVTLEVTDNGPGIPREMHGRIFDPFFTTKAKGMGTGLGLAICHRIVTQIGGSVSVHSDVGAGTSFRVTLPIAPSTEKAPVGSASPKPSAERGRWRVLVIDDEPVIGRSIKKLLPHHDVEVVTTGKDALDRLRASPELDVVVCDLMMPMMSGMDLHAQISAERPGLERRFVFVTGGAFTERAIAFLARTPNVRVDKPFQMQALEAAMAETIERARDREPST